jgi:hypothetical protein
MLYYCAIDAHTHQKKEMGFKLLSKILKHYDEMDDKEKLEIRLPVLFRYTPSQWVTKLCY